MDEFKESRDTICWYCDRACGGKNGCSWSRTYTPVEGWTAIRNDMGVQRGYLGRRISRSVESYRVIKCPEFKATGHNRAAWDELLEQQRKKELKKKLKSAK